MSTNCMKIFQCRRIIHHNLPSIYRGRGMQEKLDLSLSLSRSVPMLSSAFTRILNCNRNSNLISAISGSLILSKHLSSIPRKALFSFPSSVRTELPSSSSSSSSSPPSKPLFFVSISNSTMASHSAKDDGSIHQFTVKDAKGNDVDLSTYKGKVLLIVNVASQCGLTNSNYTELSQLYEKYKDQGLEILAFPCNQFGEQEPGNNEQILEFACTRFKAEYPIFDKVEVNGENAAPVYKFLKSSKGGLLGDNIKWNFSKFLVDKDGNVVDRYAPTTSPLSIEKDIKKLLGITS